MALAFTNPMCDHLNTKAIPMNDQTNGSQQVGARLAALSLKGLPTPTTLVMNFDEIRALGAGQYYYVRNSTRTGKLAALGDVNTILILILRNPSVGEWQVQEVLRFSYSGVAVIARTGAVAEIVAGNPVCLLREGRLAERIFPGFELPSQHYPQEVRYDPTNTGLKRTQLTVFEDSNHTLISKVENLLRAAQDAEVTGIVEWIITAEGELVFLDYKVQTETGLARMLQVCMTGTSSTRAEPKPPLSHFRLPNLAECPDQLPDGSIILDSGARLSHVVTRSRPESAIYFLK